MMSRMETMTMRKARLTRRNHQKEARHILYPIPDHALGHQNHLCSPSALLNAKDEKHLTPILQSWASHCLLPISHLTADKAETCKRGAHMWTQLSGDLFT
eukprot:4830687-Amphidinium_carterae.4